MAALSFKPPVPSQVAAFTLECKSNAFESQTSEKRLARAGKGLRFQPSCTVLRSSLSRSSVCTKSASEARVSAVAFAAAETKEFTVEERVKLTEEEKEATTKAFRIEEVETAAQEEFISAKVVSVRDVADGVRVVTLDAEISREFVPLDKAYTKPGQEVQVRLPSGSVVTVPPSSPPFPSEMNHAVLYKLKGDIPAGATKLPSYVLSVRAPLDLHVEQKLLPELFFLEPGAQVALGAFGLGMDLRPIMFLSRFPTILIFALGPGIATAKALAEAKDVGSLQIELRNECRIYVWAASPSALPYQEHFQEWEAKKKALHVRPIVGSVPEGKVWEGMVGSLASAFDQDDDLEYDPDKTAAIICCGSAEETEEVVTALDGGGLSPSQILIWPQ
eukprot:TRINITY_DN8469_c0_g1_i6.p1 TRINITY_DN8469_c0_g1~~TRINITY_DN8469_c0_g1_i6.p1  ORF type:complete len:389 (+),score=86.04 TRINITY_DN8469_c0_g1_i6:60-1226(+)